MNIPTPVTNIEKYLYCIATGNKTSILEPVTRIEKYLSYIAERGV